MITTYEKLIQSFQLFGLSRVEAELAASANGINSANHNDGTSGFANLATDMHKDLMTTGSGSRSEIEWLK